MAVHWLWYTLPLVYFPGLDTLLGGPHPPLRESLRVRRVVAVAAHPDDLEYFCGGALCQLGRAGARVVAVLATRGGAGGDPTVRVQEQKKAAALLGYSGLHLLDFPDRSVRSEDPRLRQELAGILEREQPDLLLTFDTDYPYPIYRHSDHTEVARATLDLWRGPALLFHTRRPTMALDITDVFDAKVAAFAAHASQLPRWGTARLVGWHLGRRHARGGCRYFEAFRER